MNELDLFSAAIAIGDRSQRSAFLDQECAEYPELRRRLALLLDQHARSHELLDRPNGASPVRLGNDGETELRSPPVPVGTVIAGRYKLLEQIGDGGMGAVWMAEQREPVKRLVAIKLIKPGMDSKAVLARFEAERQALAMMDHPNIAKVFDAGTEEGRPYFVMELVKGQSLTDYCDARRLSVKDRLELYVQICSAVQHAHQKAVIHRDLKPSNILVTEHDGKPMPKVIDFGLAKALGASGLLTDRTLHTAYGMVVGTPLYMAPEQVGINSLDVDTRSDIYALGVILYELLTGATPLEKAKFKEAAWEEVKRLICEVDPPKPSTRLSSDKTLASLAASRQVDPAQLRRQVQGELDWIVMKALEKDRGRRYETATGLAKDVQRFLTGEAVEACPPTLGYRLRKAYHRNRVAVVVGSTIATALLLATCVSLVFGIQASRAEYRAAQKAGEAQDERDKVIETQEKLEIAQKSRERSDYVSSINIAQAARQQYLFSSMRDILNRTRPELRGWEWHYMNGLCQPNELFSLPVNGADIRSAKYSSDGQLINVNDGSSVKVWDITEKQLDTLCEIPVGADIDISPDKKQVLISNKNKVTILDLETQTARTLLVENTENTDEQLWFSACFSPDGETIAISRLGYPDKSDNEVEMASLFNAKTGKSNWSYNARNLRFSGSGSLSGASFAANGRWLYATVWEPSVESLWKDGAVLKIWDVDTGKQLLSEGQKRTACIGPKGSRVAAMDTENHVSVWRIESEGDKLVLDKASIVLRGHTGTSAPRAFSRDDKYLLTAGVDGTVRIWDAATGAQLRVLDCPGFVWADFSPDAKHVITWGGRYKDAPRVWAVQVEDPQVVSAAEARVYTSVPSPNGKLLLTFDDTGAKVVDAATRTQLYPPLAKGRGGWSPDTRRIWISSSDNPASATGNKVSVYDAETGQLLKELDGARTPQADYCFNADGSQLLIDKQDGSRNVWEWNTDQIRELAKPAASENVQVGYSPDGSKIFITRQGDRNSERVEISIVDAKTHNSIALDTDALDLRGNVTFSHDGQTFLGLFANSDPPYGSDCRIWDANTGKLLHEFRTNAWSSPNMQISPDDSRILIRSFLDKLLLIDAKTGDELLALPFSGLQEAAYNWDGSKIIVRAGREIRVLDGTPRPMPEPKK